MTGKESRAYLLAAVMGVVALGSLGWTAATVYTDLQTTGTMTIGSNLTVSGTSTLTGAVSGTGDLSSGTSLTAPKLILDTATDIAISTPTADGEIIRTATFQVYIGTGTDNVGQWVLVGSQS